MNSAAWQPAAKRAGMRDRISAERLAMLAITLPAGARRLGRALPDLNSARMIESEDFR